jgi:hypothetical protein
MHSTTVKISENYVRTIWNQIIFLESSIRIFLQILE